MNIFKSFGDTRRDCPAGKIATKSPATMLLERVRMVALGCVLWPGASLADPLPLLNLDPAATTVSGLSSGAFMAVQLQVAFSSAISGVGIVAGGPFNCADKSVWRALYVCMNPFWDGPDPAEAVASMRTLAEQGTIDPLDDIAADRIYLFHGKSDHIVARATMDVLKKTYLSLGIPEMAINYTASVDAGHGFVTEQALTACAKTQPDFLIDCDIDQAGDILNWLYGELSQPIAPRDFGLLTFDQSLYTEDVAGMDSKAFVYVPVACTEGEVCRLHIALHGCNQGRETMGEDYARLTGYNGWAEANNIVVLYPQAVKTPSPWYNWFAGNPKGCWDWWGYSASDYLSRTAPQPAAISRMAGALGVALGR